VPKFEYDDVVEVSRQHTNRFVLVESAGFP
jgi:hypothetical protein